MGSRREVLRFLLLDFLRDAFVDVDEEVERRTFAGLKLAVRSFACAGWDECLVDSRPTDF